MRKKQKNIGVDTSYKEKINPLFKRKSKLQLMYYIVKYLIFLGNQKGFTTNP